MVNSQLLERRGRLSRFDGSRQTYYARHVSQRPLAPWATIIGVSLTAISLILVLIGWTDNREYYVAWINKSLDWALRHDNEAATTSPGNPAEMGSADILDSSNPGVLSSGNPGRPGTSPGGNGATSSPGGNLIGSTLGNGNFDRASALGDGNTAPASDIVGRLGWFDGGANVGGDNTPRHSARRPIQTGVSNTGRSTNVSNGRD